MHSAPTDIPYADAPFGLAALRDERQKLASSSRRVQGEQALCSESDSMVLFAADRHAFSSSLALCFPGIGAEESI